MLLCESKLVRHNPSKQTKLPSYTLIRGSWRMQRARRTLRKWHRRFNISYKVKKKWEDTVATVDMGMDMARLK